MSDDARPESRTRVFSYDRHGRLLGSEELTDEELAALRQRLSRDAGTTPGRPGGPAGSFTLDSTDHVTSYIDGVDDRPRPRTRFEHDPAARVFRLTTADGTVEVFRDNPTRYLCVEPDPESGEMRPMMKRGRPVYLYLCREERESR